MKKRKPWPLVLVVLLVCLITTAGAEGRDLTRGETADLLLSAADDYNPDVKRSDILKGYPNGDLAEDETVSRVQALVMLERAFGTLPTPVGDNARSAYPAANFTDVPKWAQEELASVFAAGIVAGTSETTFSPNDVIQDWQLDLFIQRVYALEGSNQKDDFYATVNKDYLDNSVIQPGYTGAGTIYDLSIAADKQVTALVQSAAADPKTEAEKKISVLYNNILDTEARNAAGIRPIQKYLDAVENAEAVADLISVEKTLLNETGIPMLLGFDLSVDAKDSNAYLLSFGTFEPGLGKDGYETATEAQKEAYLTYLTSLLVLTGETKEQAAADSQRIWEAEKAIAAASLTEQEQYDVEKTYNIYTMEQLKAVFPGVDLEGILAADGLTRTDEIQVLDTGAMKAVAKYFTQDELETLRAILRLNIANSFGGSLNEEFTKVSNDFQAAYLGADTTIPTEELAAKYVMSFLSDYLGQAYVDRYFSIEAKTDVEQMVKDIIATYESRIQALSWMSDETKEKAIQKLNAITLHIGYPDTWKDPYRDTKFLTVQGGGSFYDNVIQMNLTDRKQTAEKQFQPVDKNEWYMSAYTVNAYYDLTANSINFPAGILQAPFYDVNASYEENLGGIGYVIAHEITHAFDNNGAKYDVNGNAADWWQPEDYAAFQELCQDVVTLYDGKECAPGISCNGELTLSENIADLGAIACITQLESQQEKPNYAALYTAAGEMWCATYSREYKQNLSITDVHAPAKLRGSLVFQNFQPFYDAFDIQERDGMWLAPEERVQIW